MFCNKCGKKLPDNAKFCSACGNNLSAAIAAHNAAQPMQHTPVVPPIPQPVVQPKVEEPMQHIPVVPEQTAPLAERIPREEMMQQSQLSEEDKTVLLFEEDKTEILTDNNPILNNYPINYPEEPQVEKKKNNWVLLIVGIVVVLLLIAVAVLYFTGQFDAIISKLHPSETQEQVTTEGEDEAAPEEEENETINAELTSEEPAAEEPEEDPYTMLTSVSVDKTKLYENPDPNGNILRSLEIGTGLKWYGEEEMVDEEVYYKVTTMDGNTEGYVADSEVASVHFNPTTTYTSMVETDTTLYTYDMMVDDITALCNKYPNALTYRSIGMSYDGRDLYCVTLGNPDAMNHIMVTAAIHGREYMTTQLVMKMLEYYAEYYDTGDYDGVKYSDLFNNTAFHVVTMSNPDGVTIAQLGADAMNDPTFTNRVYECYERDKFFLEYEIDTNGDPIWTDHWKEVGYNVLLSDNPTMITYAEYQTLWKANAYGIDLNKNFDASWEMVNSREDPSYSDYKGPGIMSDVETALLYTQALQYDYVCFLNYHSRGNLIYYDVNGNSEENSIASGNLAQAISKMNKYKLSNNKTAYNVSLGGFGDWVQLSLNKPSVTIECGKRPCPLLLDEFDSMYLRNKEVWAMLAKEQIK